MSVQTIQCLSYACRAFKERKSTTTKRTADLIIGMKKYPTSLFAFCRIGPNKMQCHVWQVSEANFYALSRGSLHFVLHATEFLDISWQILSDCEPRLPNSRRSAFWRATSASRPSWLLALLVPPPDPPPAPPPPVTRPLSEWVVCMSSSILDFSCWIWSVFRFRDQAWATRCKNC